MNSPHKKYNLFTAITMIVGICIGSGIFFKSDNILIATNGSIALGVILFVIAAIAIIFGSLTISELSARIDHPGGIISYSEVFINKKTACGFGWFQTFVYYPTITVVVSWVIGVYTCILFNLNSTLELQVVIGFGFLMLCFIYNVLCVKLGAYIQNGATIIKMIPLFLLGILGILFGDPLGGLSTVHPEAIIGSSWLGALGPIAYSYDGWIVATSISGEIKNAKRNLPKALTIAPLIILVVYTVYFVGISSYVGPENVMALGDSHVSIAAHDLLGATFSKMITVFVIISVMGTVNGLVTGFIRMPYSLAIRRGMIFKASILSRVNEKLDIPVASAIFSFLICCFWMGIHYICMKYNVLFNSDVSEISISIAYIMYIALYYRVFKMYLQKEITSIFKGVICPLFATLGSFIILSGGIQNKLFIFYVLFCISIYGISQWYYKKHNSPT